ncbi:MAG: lysoplasmalogenase family protein [Planctomycetia bacterium]|nr:lysoplasmalogenase family protein [Planctomycetia bacterium]
MIDRNESSPIVLPRAALALLWLAWAVLLPVNFTAEFALGYPSFAPWFYSSAVLAATAWLTWACARRQPAGRFAALVASGMTLGFLADLYGSHPWPVRVAEPLMVIIPLFGLGHVAYIAGGIDVLRRLGLPSRPGWLRTLAAAIAFWTILGVVLWLLLVYPSDDHVAARWPCLAYSVLLATTTGLLTALAVLDRRFVPMAVGAILFLASDGFLAVRLFQDNVYRLGDACWITYGIGQMLIVFGAACVVARMAAPQPHD